LFLAFLNWAGVMPATSIPKREKIARACVTVI